MNFDANEDRVDRRTTVCSPTFLVNRRSNASLIFGGLLFLLFTVVIIALVVSIVTIITAPLAMWIKLLSGVIVLVVLYFVVFALLVIDTLNSLDDKASLRLEYTRRMEDNIYNLYLLHRMKGKGDGNVLSDKR